MKDRTGYLTETAVFLVAGLLNPQSSRRRDGALLKSYLRFGGVDKEYQGGEKVAQNSGTIVIRIH